MSLANDRLLRTRVGLTTYFAHETGASRQDFPRSPNSASLPAMVMTTARAGPAERCRVSSCCTCGGSLLLLFSAVRSAVTAPEQAKLRTSFALNAGTRYVRGLR